MYQEDKKDLQRVLAPHRLAIPRRAFYELCFSSISFSPSHIKKDMSRRSQQVSSQVEIDMGSLSRLQFKMLPQMGYRWD